VSEVAVLVPGLVLPVIAASAGPGAATGSETMDGEPAVLAGHRAVRAALALRDQALAELDGGNPEAGLVIAARGLAVLEAAGLAAGADAAAVLVAVAEIEECVGCFGDAAVTIGAAIAILDGGALDGGDDDLLLLWCQAQERLAGLQRAAGNFDAARARLRAVLDRASAAFGEASMAVVSAANALGVAGKYAGDLAGAEAAYRRAMAAFDGLPGADPLIRAGLLHNLGGLAHSRGDTAAGIPAAEQGLALRTAVLGDGHPDVARDLNALGALYHLADRLGDAAAAYGRALQVFEYRYGPGHFEVAMTCANLAVLASDQGRWADAESLGRRSLRILQTVLGPDDSEVGLTLLNLGAAVAGQGRRAEAAALTARAVAILWTRLPAGHPHTAAARQALRSLRRPS
jgi:tetratricopeptide (TPR) repeat protein